MTRLSVEQEALVGEVANAWRTFKAERAGAEARVRALVAADVAKSIAMASVSVTAALNVALVAGVPKRALKEVTTKDRLSFEAFLPPKETEPVEPTAGPESTEVECSWDGELIRVRLDPSTLPDSEWNPSEPEYWTAEFEYFVRPGDGTVFLDPPMGTKWPHGAAVHDWIRSGQNTSKVADWAAASERP